MDPLGFALENFDAVGRFRTEGLEFQLGDNHGFVRKAAGWLTAAAGIIGIAGAALLGLRR